MPSTDQDPEAMLPLTPAVFHILLALADGERHGYSIMQEIAAHTQGKLQWAETRFRVGIQGFVGVDTVIGRYPLGVIEGQGKLGYDTVLGNPADEASRPSMKIGEASRLGCNTVLK